METIVGVYTATRNDEVRVFSKFNNQSVIELIAGEQLKIVKVTPEKKNLTGQKSL